jgi:Holliday junction resolvasome RuvABC ATP-dependent DNA helicase subunit
VHSSSKEQEDKNRPFYRAAKIMELGPITTDELAKFIKKRFAKIVISISGQLALRIAERVNGHPDYAQRLCSHIFDIIESNPVEEELVEKGVVNMLVSLTPSLLRSG